MLLLLSNYITKFNNLTPKKLKIRKKNNNENVPAHAPLQYQLQLIDETSMYKRNIY